MLESQINSAFLEAYKAKDEALVSTLRMLKSAILNKKIEKSLPKEEILADDEVMAVLKSEAKKRADSVESYRAAGREDLAQKEEAEIIIIKKFLPEQLSEEAVRELVVAVIAESGNPGPSGFGKIMSAVMARAKGAADGAAVSKAVKEELGK
ncbi:MAG: GatB/YqeY domain-containing protein [Patescibacteria group bacterium]